MFGFVGVANMVNSPLSEHKAYPMIIRIPGKGEVYGYTEEDVKSAVRLLKARRWHALLDRSVLECVKCHLLNIVLSERDLCITCEIDECFQLGDMPTRPDIGKPGKFIMGEVSKETKRLIK